MDLKTERQRVQEAIARAKCGSASHPGQAGAVAAMDPETATAAEIRALTDLFLWPEPCSECGQDAPSVVYIGKGSPWREEPYGREPVAICLECARKAVAMLEAPRK